MLNGSPTKKELKGINPIFINNTKRRIIEKYSKGEKQDERKN